MSKKRDNEKLIIERKLVAAIRDKMDALANAHFFKHRNPEGKNYPSRGYAQMSSAEKKRAMRLKTQGIRNEINLLLCACRLRPHRKNPEIPSATPEESCAIRFDFDGIIHRPANIQLSQSYAKAKLAWLEYSEQYTAKHLPEYHFRDYQLEASAEWCKLSLFPNFQRCQKRIIHQLQKTRIPPTVIKNMNYYDFVDILADSSKESGKPPFEGSRSKNLKMFAACYGEEFRHIMLSLRYKPKAINEMLQRMHHGKTPEIMDIHHKTNVANFKELRFPEQINDFPNMLLTFIHPHHHSLHFDKGYDIDKNIVFFGGYDIDYRICRNPQREREYLQNPTQVKKHGKSH